jgi:glycosyltransferase involved in cell wall biosynthesis
LAHAASACLLIGYHTRYDRLVELYWSAKLRLFSKALLRSWDRLFFRAGRAVLVNSREMADNARRLGAREVHRVGTPLARHLLEPPVSPVSGKIRSVLFAGRLAAEKNTDALLECAVQQPHRRFVLAGDGPLRQAVVLAAQQQPNLEYRGWVNRCQIPELIDECDLLVLPSKEEAFGTMALEGMARQRMVLVSRGCGILNWPELSAGLFRIHRKETLAEAIDRVDALEPALKMRRARKARRAAEAFSRAALEDWLALFRRWLAQNPPPAKG